MHPLRVANFLAQWEFKNDVIIAASCTILRKKKSSLFEIERHFGFDAAEMVDSFSKVNKDLTEASGLNDNEIESLAPLA